MRSWMRWWLVSMLSLVAVLGGCKSAQQTPRGNDYASLYAQGRYSDAYDSAVRVAGTPKGGSPQAALIAGLSAQALGREADAQRWLTPLVDNADPNVAGKSGAALGLIAKENGENTKAAALLEKASTRLQDDDAARALMYAGDANRSMKREMEAHALYLRARDKATRDVTLKGAIESRLAGAGKPSTVVTASTGRWSVQGGAFATVAKAQSMMTRLATKGPVRIVPLNKTGTRLYYVRVGRYATKTEAENVRRAIGAPAFVVDASDER
ncbi:MAG: SPOR domain-containing protein [Phycisphaerales bacterium]